MKQIFRLLIVLHYFVCTAYGQQPDTYFIYQKNETFDAILMDRVDSIVFSRFDLDSVIHDNVVTQEFWYQGKTQRFLIEDIDSISFYKPETKYKADVFHITAFHIPYALGIDSLTLTFDNTIPSDRLPEVGQVVISDVRDHPFERGFAGRLREINNTDYGIELVCERVSIVDIFDRLLAVGHVQATPDNVSNDSNNVRRSAIEGEGTYQLITDKEISLPLKVITITDKINYSVDYLVNIGLFRKPIVKVCVNGKHELHGISKLSVKEKEEWDLWPEKLSWNFPIPGLEILTVSLKFGAFAYAGGKMELKGDVPLTLTHSFGFEWKDNGLTPIKSFDYEWGDPEVTLDINGTLRAGIMMKLGINLISDDVVSANVTGKIGPQLDAHLVFSSDGALDQSWYQTLKDTRATLSLYGSLDAAFEVFGKDVEDVLDISITEPWEGNWLKHTAYLLPKFTTPELVPYAPDYANYSLTSLMTIPSRSTLLPVAVGIGMFDRGGNRIAEKWSGQWWTEPSNPLSKKVQYELVSAESHRTHVFRPIVKFLGITINAYPEMEFTVPGKITLAADHVMLKEGMAKTIEITDGWGLYGSATDQQDVVKESLFGYPDGSHYLYLEGLHAGETTVSVKDIRTEKIVSLQVKVVDPNELLVNPYKVTVTENESADVTVSGGTGHYKLSSYDNELIDAEFVNTDVIRITALNEGEAIILVEDSQNDYFTNIQVKINPKPKSVVLSPIINMTAGDSRLIEIGGYNGKVEIYKEAENFKIASDAPDVASVRLAPGNTYYVLKVYALKEGIAHITIEDISTGDKSTMEVNVGPTSSISYTITDGNNTTYIVNGVPFKMINVEGGIFTMGRTPEQGLDYKDSGYAFFNYGMFDNLDKTVFYDDYTRDLPTHQESVANFSIGEMPVTWELYKAVMGEGEGKDDKPIVRSYADFNGFISRLSEITKLPFRRPTETEWEYAARGGKYSEGYKYPGTNDVIAASFGIPNELGISNLAGGCNEECNEDYLYLDSGVRPGTTLRGGTANVLESYIYGAGWKGWRRKEIIPWTSFRFPGLYSPGWSNNGVSLRLALGGDIAINRNKWKTLYDHYWGSNKDLDVPLWGEVTIPVYGGYGDFEVTSKNPEIATGYSHGSEITVQCVSCGTTTITVTDKKSGTSIDFNAYIENHGFSIGTHQEINIIPVGVPMELEVGGGHGRYKFYSEDESAVTISLTPEKQMVMKGTKLGKYKVAVTDLGCHKTIDWEVEVLDTLGLSTDYITIREGDTDSVRITHGNGMYNAHCTNSDFGISIEESPNGFIYDNIIRITPSEPGTFSIAVYDNQLDRFLSYEDFSKYITVVVPDERQEKKQQLLTELASVKTLAIQTKKELAKKATEEQAYKLYASLFSCNEKILSMEYELERPHSLTELKKIEADVDALSTEVNLLYVQVNQLQQLRTDDDQTEKNLCPDENHPHLIDLGLPSGTKWACCNVGASTPEAPGGYYAWGETAEKSSYSWEGYNAPTMEDIAGTEYDVAHVQWEESWVMPTPTQWDELVYMTERTRTSRNGMNGDLYTSSNGNSVFIPYGGYKYEKKMIGIGSSAYYWSSTADQYSSMGHTVRPVVVASFTPTGNIEFADASVKAICVANWDTNGDGELSYDEAAAVTDIGVIFKENNEITSFNELRYFKGLKYIGVDAFNKCVNLSSIIIPENVATIGGGTGYTFYGCNSLAYLYLPKNVSYIGCRFMFYGCNNLAAIDVDAENNCYTSVDGVLFSKDMKEIVNYPPGKTDNSYTIPDEVTYIYNDAFAGCNNLTSVNLNNVQIIGEDAFAYCRNLTSAILTNSVIYISSEAFMACTSLSSLSIPSSVTNIAETAFMWCNSLTSIDIEEGNDNYSSNDGVLYNKNMTTLLLCPTSKEVASYTIPDGVIRIGNNAFANCSGLKTVSIPNSVTEIGAEAFYCSGLTSITLPEGLKDIDDMVFQGCSGLTTIVIPNSVESIGYQAFCSCEGLTSAIIGSGMKRVGQSAFINCNRLKDVFCYAEEVPDADMSSFEPEMISLHVPTASIDDYLAVEPWKNFRAILSINDVSSFTTQTAENVEMYFTVISVKEKTCMVGENGWNTLAIDNATEGVITIPENAEGFSVIAIGSKAFYDCSGLTTVIIPSSVTTIGAGAFYDCSGLTSVTLPEGLRDINDMVFQGCSGLTTIVIPNSVKSIGYQAFADCNRLTSLTIGSGVTSIDYSFINCRRLKDVYCYAENVPEANKWNFNSQFGTLHVPAISIDAYRTVEPWKNFEKIVAIE